MHQLTFSDQSNAVLKHMTQKQQLKLVEFLGSFSFENAQQLGKIIRGPKTYFRLRWTQFRIYFEQLNESSFIIHYIIPKHTWNDFLFRFKLPFSEDLAEKNEQFWQYLEELNK